MVWPTLGSRTAKEQNRIYPPIWGGALLNHSSLCLLFTYVFIVQLEVPELHIHAERAAGLLLWVRRVGDIDRLLVPQQHGAAAASAGECGQCHFVSVRR